MADGEAIGAAYGGCMSAFRDVERAGCHPMVMRAYDEVDATLNFGRLGHPGGSVAMLGFDAGSTGLAERVAAARSAMADGEAIGAAYGEHWWEHRNAAVDTYRRIMGSDRMFGPGVMVDTMEIAGLWSALPTLYARVREALSRHAEAVGCHLSHVYPTGSSLYFTFLVRGADDHDVEGGYAAAWDAAAVACLEAGGTISHHHGVGRLKARYMEGELGPEGVEVLRRIKSALDPAGILNPGCLIP
jgi:alkyldihydroxyacetonephosphate synthase